MNKASHDLELSVHKLHRDILSTLLMVAPSSVALCYAGGGRDNSCVAGSMLRDGERDLAPLEELHLDDLLSKWPRDRGHVATENDTCTIEEGATTLARVFALEPPIAAHAASVLVALHNGPDVLGLAGVLLTAATPSPLECFENIKRLAPALSSLVASHARCAELERLCVCSRTPDQAHAHLHALPVHDAGATDVEGQPGFTPVGPGASRLSRREREIAHMLADGYAALNIAATLELSESTVRTYIRRVYRKLRVTNRADFVREYILSRGDRRSAQILVPPSTAMFALAPQRRAVGARR